MYPGLRTARCLLIKRLGICVFAFITCAVGQPSIAAAQEDVADIDAKEYVLDEDGKLKYFLIAASGELTTPEDGYKVLAVLPGGDGSADFQPFVKRIYKHALAKDYVVIQLVAPKWSSRQEIVWPTEGLPVPNMKVSTEDFIARAIEDLGKRTKLDKTKRFALAWSSGGPAVYAAALQEDSPLTGSYIAMSVFKPRQLPPLENAKGRTFYLLHSPEDRVCPYRMAKDAEKKLSAAGANIKLVTYPGGHGWRGNVFGNLRDGMKHLDAAVRKGG